MTTLSYWSAFDSHGISAIYIASDSRFTYGIPHNVKHEDGNQKVFHSPSSADIFGIFGNDVSSFRSVIADVINNLPAARSQSAMVSDYPKAVSTQVLASIRDKNVKAPSGHIIHGFRWDAPPSFGFATYAISTVGRDITIHTELTPIAERDEYSGNYKYLHELASHMRVEGSGKDSLVAVIRDNKDDGQRGFCRWHWQVFCDHIRTSEDNYTGGAPQLVGIYRKWNARLFGVYLDSVPYVRGKHVDVYSDSEFGCEEWRDELFQRIDKLGNLLPGAQRHARIASKPTYVQLATLV